MNSKISIAALVVSAVLAIVVSTGAARSTHANTDDDDDLAFTTIDFPGANSSRAYSMNRAGVIGGFYEDVAGKVHGFLLNNRGEFTSLDCPGAIFSSLGAINDRGDIVGRQITPDGKSHICLFSGGQFTSFDFPEARSTVPFGINSHGDIVGQYDSADNVTHGFLFSGGEFTSIDFPGAVATFAFGINRRGEIVGRYDMCPGDLPQCPNTGRVTHGFLLSGNEFTATDVPGAVFTAARAINDAGEIVGLFRNADGVTHGFLLSDDESMSIDFPGAAGTMAFGISGSGNILGGTCDSPSCSVTSKGHGFLLRRHEREE